MSKDFSKKGLIGFHCNQTGQKRPIVRGSLEYEDQWRCLRPATMRINDDCPFKVEAPTVKSRAFQLTVEEARATPDVVTGMWSIYVLFILF